MSDIGPMLKFFTTTAKTVHNGRQKAITMFFVAFRRCRRGKEIGIKERKKT
jgi:hypothetical protein